MRPSGSLDFHDPWGNHAQVVDYRDIQFTKTPGVLHAMSLDGLGRLQSIRHRFRPGLTLYTRSGGQASRVNHDHARSVESPWIQCASAQL